MEERYVALLLPIFVAKLQRASWRVVEEDMIVPYGFHIASVVTIGS